MYGWIVYRIGDPIECGWRVESEEEAKRQCRDDNSLDYAFVDYQFIGYPYYE